MNVTMGLIMGGKTATIGSIAVSPGDRVTAGQTLLQTETGKGSRPVKAMQDCVITNVLCAEGDQVSPGDVLLEVDPSEGENQVADAANQQPKLQKSLEADVVIIGGGPGGYVSAIYGAQKGLRVVLVERDLLGGTCLNRGCIPTKTLVSAAEAYHAATLAEHFGIQSGPVTLDYGAVMNRKNEVCTDLRQGIAFLLRKNRVEVLKGAARLESSHKVMVEGETTVWEIQGEQVILATGSSPAHLDGLGADAPFVLDSTAALDLKALPTSVTIVGGGAIGMEFAFIYRHFGAEVQVIEFLDRILATLDEDVSAEVAMAANRLGITVFTGAKVTKIEPSCDGQALVYFVQNGVNRVAVSEKVLTAMGRSANLAGLGLETVGVALTENGRSIAVDGAMRTNIPGIYAVGDIASKIQLAHVASHQGMLAIDAILGTVHSMNYDTVPSVVYTAPEAAAVGLNEEDCRRRSIPYQAGTFPFSANGKAKTMDQPQGFVKLIAHRETGRILGGAVVGPEASALISTITLAVTAGLTEATLQGMIFPHPTTSEAIFEASLRLSGKAIHFDE